MSDKKSNRREFIKETTKTGLAVGSLVGGLTAASYARVLGANERIRIGVIGCGGRGSWHIGWLQRVKESGENLEVMAACDIWSRNRERGAGIMAERFGGKPIQVKHHADLLARDDLHAVVVATADHQHCTHLRDAVKAGKDVYVEKPIALDLEDLNKAYDVVTASKQVVQHGTQGRSSAGALATKAFLQEGKLGALLRVEESRSHYIPYWNHYTNPGSEAETDWKAFLCGTPDQPFDADKHGAWMGYRPFSNGTVGGWMSHMSDFIHFATGCGFPVTAVAQGGVYGSTTKPGRDCPDSVTCLLEYAEGFVTSFTTHFGNGANDGDTLFGSKGIMRINPPDGNSGGIKPLVSGTGSEHPEKIQDDESALEEIAQDDHMTNWVKCIRSRQQPNAHMERGYQHGVAVILGDRALVEGRKMRFDSGARTIVPA